MLKSIKYLFTMTEADKMSLLSLRKINRGQLQVKGNEDIMEKESSEIPELYASKCHISSLPTIGKCPTSLPTCLSLHSELSMFLFPCDEGGRDFILSGFLVWKGKLLS